MLKSIWCKLDVVALSHHSMNDRPSIYTPLQFDDAVESVDMMDCYLHDINRTPYYLERMYQEFATERASSARVSERVQTYVCVCVCTQPHVHACGTWCVSWGGHRGGAC